MLKPRLAYALALLYYFLSSPCSTNAQRPETYIVPVTILTADGNPVLNLQSQSLRVHSRGLKVQSFSLDASPRRIVLLFDVSASMGMSNGRVTLFQAAVRTSELFLDRVPSLDSISVHVFADKDKELVPFTRDFGAVRASISNLPTPGTDESKKVYGARTDLESCLNHILALLSGHPQFGDTIIIFSDGQFPRPGRDEILNFYDQPDYLIRVTPRLGVLGVRVFLSLAGNIGGAPPLHGIESFMTATGGESIELRNPVFPDLGMNGAYEHPEAQVFRSDSIGQRAFALCAAVQDTYRAELQPTNPLEKPIRLHLNVVDEKGKALHNVALLSPEFIYPAVGTQH